ncbi:MAG: GLPGLI family protein [Bacteroidota bacterium]
MKKTLIIFIALANFFNVCFSQKTEREIIDECIYAVSYNLTYQKDTSDIYSICTESMILFVGNETSLFCSLNDFQNMENQNISSISFGNERPLEIRDKGVKPSIFQYRIYKNYPKGYITYTDFVPLSFYKYEEPLDAIEWDIKEDKRKIFGFAVQRAVAKYGGRIWEAWFATNLPINDGPYKFSGLPGLILKIQDSEKHYVFELEEVGRCDEPIPIKIAKLNYINTNRKTFHDIKKNYTQNIHEQLINLGVVMDDPEPLKAASKTDNNFLELKYD